MSIENGVMSETLSLEMIADQLREMVNLYGPLKADTTGIADRLDELEVKIDRILDSVDKTREFVAAIKDEVGPAIDAIAASPVGKVLGMGKMESNKTVKGEVE